MPESVTSSFSPLQVIGQSVTRTDARAKVTGEARFSADRLPTNGVLYGKTLRSPHPYAEIVRIDTAKAEGLPGVHAIVTFRDAPENPFEDGDDSGSEQPRAPVYLFNRMVRHVGDEVAAVAADSEENAEEALRLIEIEYRTLPFVLDAESALAPDAPSIRGGRNLAGREPILLIRGDIDRGMSEAEVIVEETYRTQSTSPLALEPRYSLAWWEKNHLTVWKASRNVYGDRDRLAKVFGLPHDQVRLIGP
jgi:xanthine dehydrogenase molybdenum-binding subunit